MACNPGGKFENDAWGWGQDMGNIARRALRATPKALSSPPPAVGGEVERVTAANNQPVELLEIGGRAVEVDYEIAPIVRALNYAGVATAASCSGHGNRPGVIALADGREIFIARSFDEARQIDALFPFDINGDAIPDREMREALDRLLATSGARGRYHALEYADAVENAERVLALTPHGGQQP
jgi:hypothetical protein